MNGDHQGSRTTRSGWNAERMLELANRHARLEGQRRLDDLMETLIETPVYEFPVQGLALRRGANVRRYYRQFFDHYMSRVSGARLLGQWADESAVARDDAIPRRTSAAACDVGAVRGG